MVQRSGIDTIKYHIDTIKYLHINIMETIKNVGYQILTSELSYFDVWRSQVIIFEQNVLVMNKSQAEKKV